MPELPAVAVVIPAHNAAPYLAQAIDSLLAQTRPPAEICVIDDGSADDTTAIAERYGDQIILLHHDTPRGSSAARNAGIKATASPLVAFLDADDIALPERLSIQSRQLEQHKDAVLTFCSMAYIDQRGIATGDVISASDYGRKGFLGRMMVRNRIGSNSAVMVRRETLFAAGGFDETLTHNEEYALWLRMAFLGPVIATPDVLVQYRLHDSNISRDRVTQQRNETHVLQQYPWDRIVAAVQAAYPTEPDHSLALARIRIRREESDQAKSILEAIQGQGLRDARVDFYLGNLYFLANDLARAKRHYEACLEQEPEMACALNNLAVVEAGHKNTALAQTLLQQALSIKPHYADAAHNLKVLENNCSESMRITETLLRDVLKPETISQIN